MRKLLMAGLALILSACASIPNVSDVQVVPDIELEFDSTSTRAIVRPPVVGMGQLEIVQGFINSHADPTANYEISRLYLARSLDKVWKASKIEIIDSPTVVYELVDSNVVAMTYDKIGTLYNSGELEFLEDPLTQVVLFELKRQSGEFRIVQTTNTAFISTADLSRSYSPQQLYFFNSEYSRLVPVSRWLPGTDIALATRLMNNLLDGPTEGLEVALRSAIPADTKLAINAVIRTNGVLVVNLTAPALAAVDNQRAAMIAQIARTLSKVGFEVRIQVNNQPLVLDGQSKFRTNGFGQYFVTNPIADYPIHSIRDSQLQRGDIENQSFVRILNQTAKFAVSPDGFLIALSDGRNTTVESVSQLGTIRQLRSPVRSFTFDSENNLWMALPDGRVQVSLENGELVQVSGIENLRVEKISINSDGIQIALIVSTSNGPQLRVGYIYKNGNSISIQNSKRVERSLGDVLDVDWGLYSQLIVLAISQTNESLVYQLNGGAFEPSLITSPITFNRISVNPGQPILAEDVDGGVWAYQAGQWRFTELVTGTRFID